MDLVITMSILLAMQSSIMWLNSTRFFVLVPLIPSSVYSTILPGGIVFNVGGKTKVRFFNLN